MSWNDLIGITEPLEAMRSLFDEMTSMKDELSSCKSEYARLNRSYTKILVEYKKVRQENKALKAENSSLRKQLEISGGTYVEKNSTNSSIPPTQQSLEQKAVQRTRSLREPSGKKSGGQPGHKGHTLCRQEKPDDVIDHKVKICPHCGAVIPDGCEQECIKSVQEIDITGVMLPPSVIQHNEYSAVCPHCHHTVKGDDPTGKCKNVVYGPKLQTMVVYLSVVQSIPYNRICDILRDVFLVPTISEGTVKNILAKNKEKAMPIYDSILNFIELMKAAGMDETSVYINKRLCWFWCLQCPKYCYVFADASRGIQALENHDIPKHLEGLILYTDRHGTYFKLKVMGHQVCLVHLIRNLNYLNDLNPEQKWSSGIQDILREAMHQKNTVPLAQIDVESFKNRLHEMLEADVSPYEHKGKTDFQTLQNGLINCEDYIFTFLLHDEVPHHNNSSEGTIRVLKVKQKVSGGFRTDEGADEFACFHSIAETAKRNGVSKFNALYQLISDIAPKEDFIENLISKEG